MLASMFSLIENTGATLEEVIAARYDHFYDWTEKIELVRTGYIAKKLEEARGNISRAAELLGLERSHLYKKMRALGIPTIRDRVVQTAAKLVLEPIFEADFEDSA